MVDRASVPKRRVHASWVAVVLVMALVGAGCGSTATDEGQVGTTETTQQSQPALDQAALKAALLTPTDLGPGWDYVHYPSSGLDMQNAAEQSPGLWGVGLCPSAQSKAYADPTWSVGSWMDDSIGGLGLQESLAVPRDATKEFQLMRDAFDSCLGQPWTSGSDLGSMEAIPAPSVGDDAAAYVTTVRSPDVGGPGGVSTSRSMTVVVRRGPVIEIYETGRSTPEELAEIVTVGDDKVATALAGTVASTVTTTSTVATTSSVAPSPSGTKPSCDEVQAAIATMSGADVATLRKAPMLFFSRLPGSGDGWRITALGDVTGTAPRPDVVVYYDWTPSTGLGPPVVVLNPDDLDVLEGDDTSVMLIGMDCINATVNVNP